MSSTITCRHVKMQMALIARRDAALFGYTDRVTASFYIRRQCESRVGRKLLWQPYAVSNDDRWVQARMAPSCRRITGQALALPLRANSTHTGFGPQSDLHAMLWADTVHRNMTADICAMAKPPQKVSRSSLLNVTPDPSVSPLSSSSLIPVWLLLPS